MGCKSAWCFTTIIDANQLGDFPGGSDGSWPNLQLPPETWREPDLGSFPPFISASITSIQYTQRWSTRIGSQHLTTLIGAHRSLLCHRSTWWFAKPRCTRNIQHSRAELQGFPMPSTHKRKQLAFLRGLRHTQRRSRNAIPHGGKMWKGRFSEGGMWVQINVLRSSLPPHRPLKILGRKKAEVY